MRLFDTTFIVDLVNSDPSAVRLAKRVDGEASLVAVSVVSVHEYLFGVYFRYGRNNDDDVLRTKLASAQNDLGRFEVIPLTRDLAELSCNIQAQLASAGKQIGINDVYIGATAVRYNLALVTRNKAHFARIPKLRLENY